MSPVRVMRQKSRISTSSRTDATATILRSHPTRFDPDDESETIMKRDLTLVAVIACVAACSTQQNEAGMPAPRDSVPAAPWQGGALAEANVPSVHIAVWRAAENRSTCAPVGFSSAPRADEASPRAATFSGGWGVAYDLPDLRSAFGVAGTGVEAAASTYDQWPYTRAWSDGSSVGYGPEGGTGPNQLAYLRIAGQGCLYNMWSRLGTTHLESLLGSIRFIDTSGE
jgi:hypothetical protein